MASRSGVRLELRAERAARARRRARARRAGGATGGDRRNREFAGPHVESTAMRRPRRSPTTRRRRAGCSSRCRRDRGAVLDCRLRSRGPAALPGGRSRRRYGRRAPLTVPTLGRCDPAGSVAAEARHADAVPRASRHLARSRCTSSSRRGRSSASPHPGSVVTTGHAAATGRTRRRATTPSSSSATALVALVGIIITLVAWLRAPLARPPHPRTRARRSARSSARSARSRSAGSRSSSSSTRSP